MTPYIDIRIGNKQVDVQDALALSIKYKLEDPGNFQSKTSDQAFDITLPLTKVNEEIANSYQDPNQDDLSPNQEYRSHRPASISANGSQLLAGKAFLTSASNRGYQYSFYGGNGDWIIDLKEATLFDFLKQINFIFSRDNVIASFAYDGTDEALPYVFAPVKFRGPMAVFQSNDATVDTSYLRPSLSVYWLIYWGFKSLGYRINSDFMDTSYFRRMVMPWTWGNFLDSDGTELQIHKFLARSVESVWTENTGNYLNLLVTNDLTLGGFDNNNEYSYNAGTEMTWEYKTPDFGILDATLSTQISYNSTLVGANAYCHTVIRWFHYKASTGITTQFQEDRVVWASGNNLTRKDIVGIDTYYATKTVAVGDKIIAKVYQDCHEGKGIGSRANNTLEILAYRTEYFRVPIGGTINFENYIGFKKFKFLEFLAGVCDLFDLSVNTDNVAKVVTLEPSHAYSLTNNLAIKSGGYFNGNTLDWSSKKDESTPWKLDLYADYEKEVLFKYKDDSNDGILKKLQDRNQTTLSMGKYVFPSRFKAGKKEYENRFFAATTHYDAINFTSITGVTPQLVCMIPENISNTSNSESANTFAPKICYYKGEVDGVGGWSLDNNPRTNLPFMFAVNYKSGGENDPVLSYGDERVGTGQIAKGLLKRFFWQRLAIMRNGQFYNTAVFRLTDEDVSRKGHREFKIVDGVKYELIEITAYSPTENNPSPCVLRKWEPIGQVDFDNTFPSADALAVPPLPILGFDIKYAQAKALTSDIPTG